MERGLRMERGHSVGLGSGKGGKRALSRPGFNRKFYQDSQMFWLRSIILFVHPVNPQFSA